MGVIGGTAGYWLLTKLCPRGETGYLSGEAYANTSKLGVLLGQDFFDAIGQPWLDPWDRRADRVRLSQPTRNAA